MKDRIPRLNELIKKEVNQILLKDFEFSENTLVTITRVETTPNLILAKIYISVLPEKETLKILNIFKKIVFAIQQKLNKRLRMRPVPKILFKREEKTSEAGRIEEILEEIKRKEL